MPPESNFFLAKFKENADYNQYWYSAHTIDMVVKELHSVCKNCAFLSTPSLYFSLGDDSTLKSSSWIFDYDSQWSKDPHYVKYDFNNPADIPENLHRQFDCVVIDPPFITEDVWRKYSVTAKLLLKPGGKVVASSIAENKEMLKKSLGVLPCQFRPSIPNLIYQYNFFVNFEPTYLNEENPEVGSD